MGDARAARTTLEAALAQARERGDDANSLAEHEFRLAQALWLSPASRQRALAMASEGTKLLETQAPSTLVRQLQDEMIAWRSARSAR